MAYDTGIQSWQTLKWNDETMKIIYREWGKYFGKRNIVDKAALYYTKSMLVDQYDVGCLQNRSIAYLQIADGVKALNDSSAAIKLRPLDCPINLQYSKVFFDNNDFENCITTLHNNSRKFIGGKLKPFKEQISMLESTFGSNINESLVKYSLKNQKTFIKVGKMMKNIGLNENFPWKELSKEGKCDCESVNSSDKSKLIHPKIIERRKLQFKVANQHFLGRSWIDLVFLSKLQHDNTLLLKQTTTSTKQLLNQLTKFDQIKKFVKMFQARNPLFNVKVKCFPNEKLYKKSKQDHLFRVQSQTRRDIHIFLYKIKELRKQGKIIELRNYIEHIMSNYTIIKTKEIMPWKYEFVLEVYNLIALAYIDQLTVPHNILDYNLEYRNFRIFRIKPLKDKEIKPYVFGDRTTYVPPDLIDHEYIKYKFHVNRLEKWLKFSSYPIEKSFIYNLISHHHLEHGKYLDCIQSALKGKSEAIEAKSIVWNILCSLQIIKAETLQKKYDVLVIRYSNMLKLLNRLKKAQNLKLLFEMANNNNIRMRNYMRKLKNLTQTIKN